MKAFSFLFSLVVVILLITQVSSTKKEPVKPTSSNKPLIRLYDYGGIHGGIHIDSISTIDKELEELGSLMHGLKVLNNKIKKKTKIVKEQHAILKDIEKPSR